MNPCVGKGREMNATPTRYWNSRPILSEAEHLTALGQGYWLSILPKRTRQAISDIFFHILIHSEQLQEK